MNRIYVCFAAGWMFVVLILSSSCGTGQAPRPNLREAPDVESGMPAYVPFVQGIELSGTLEEGAVIAAKFHIDAADDFPIPLYIYGTLSDPIEEWYSSAGSISVLCPISYTPPPTGYLPYDGSGVIVHYILLPEPGHYVLTYWSSVSPEAAGVYDISGSPDPQCVRYLRFARSPMCTAASFAG